MSDTEKQTQIDQEVRMIVENHDDDLVLEMAHRLMLEVNRKHGYLDQDDPPRGLKINQIQYQLLTGQLALTDPFESEDDAPENVVEGVDHIQQAMTLIGGVESAR